MNRRLSILLLLSASGCFYSFDNPVELQDAGSIAGHVVFTENPTGLKPGGGQVGLLWTDLNITVRDDGRFVFLGLPDGVYTVKYELDPGDGGLPLIAFIPGITLPQEPGNVPDAIDIGTLVLNPVARITGHVTGMGDAGAAVVGAFGPADAGEIFESFTVMTDDAGGFTLDVPNGSHDIWASTASASGSTAVTVPAGKITDIGELALAPPSGGGPSASRRQGDRADQNNGDPNGELVGDVVLGLPGFGAEAAPAAVADAGLVQSNVEIDPPPPPEDPFTLAPQVPGKGAHMNQTLPPGQLYPAIFCGLKGTQPPGPDRLNDIGLQNIPTFVGHPTILGQITWLPVSTFAANDQSPPPNYSTGTTTGGTSSGTAGGTLSGGSSTGGGSSSGGASSNGGSTTGFPYFDAGPPASWQEIAESPVADGGFGSSYPFIPVPTAGGPEVFYSDGLTVTLASIAKGQLELVSQFNGNGDYINLLGGTSDELGVPTAIIDYYSQQTQAYAFSALQQNSVGRWIRIPCSSEYVYERPVLIPAPAGSSADGGPALYIFYVGNSSSLSAAAIYTQNKPHCDALRVHTPDSNDAGISYLQQVAGAACEVNGNPGACLALTNYDSDYVSGLAVDLSAPETALIDPIQLSYFDDGYVPLGLSAVVTGPPGSQLMTATWYEGYVDPVPGQMLAQRVPVVDLSTSTDVELPPVLTFDAGYDEDGGRVDWYFQDTLALSSGGLPIVIGTASYNLPTQFYPPNEYFTYDLVSGAPFPNIPPDAGVAAPLSGYVDEFGHPVVSGAMDYGTSLNAQIWTYAP